MQNNVVAIAIVKNLYLMNIILIIDLSFLFINSNIINK